MVSAEIAADRTEVYVHEQVTLTLTMRCSGEPISKTLSLQRMPDPSVLRLGQFSELQPSRQMDGVMFHDVRRFRCSGRAAAPGTVEVRPVLIVESLFWSRRYDVPVRPCSITVLPLPEENRPADFSGAVGDFSFEARVSPSEPAVGDLITVTSRVSGGGYTDGMDPPRVRDAAGFKAYDPRLVRQTAAESVYEQILVPQSTNSAAVPPLRFSFFDPGRKAYRSLDAGPFPLRYVAKRRPEAFVRYQPGETAAADAPARRERAGPLDGLLSGLRGHAAGGRWSATACVALASLAYGVAAVAAASALARRSRRRKRDRAALAALLLAAAAGVFFPYRAGVRRLVSATPEAAVGAAGAARFAPSASAAPTFELKDGATVRVLETWGGWAKIESGGNRGWIPLPSLRQR
jgi:hypothetical protein